MRALVFGASGYIGSHLVPYLLERGHSVRASSRHLDVLEARRWPGVDLVAADALDPRSLVAALDGVDVAYYLVHSMAGGKGFASRDRKAANNFASAAGEAGVQRIVYLGGIQPRDVPSMHLESRRETGDALRSAGVPVTELRAGLIVGAGSAGFEVIRDLVYHLPIMVTPRWVRSWTQPIALDDVLEYLVRLSGEPAAAGRVFDIGGPEVLRYGDLLIQFAEVAGTRRPRFIPVPFLTPGLSGLWLDLVTSVPRSVVRPLLDGLLHDLVADDAPARELATFPLKSYREAVAAALESERGDPLPARWTEGALAYRGYNPEVSFYSKGESTTTNVGAPASDTWAVVRTIGGQRGYFYANFLWRVRGWMDRAVGGIGLRRGRRHPTDIRVGDAIDFWRVAAVEEGKGLTLVAEMKLPGVAVLEFEVEPDTPSTSKLITRARFHPSGMPGLLYWYAVSPFHGLIFSRMPASIARAAESIGAKVS